MSCCWRNKSLRFIPDMLSESSLYALTIAYLFPLIYVHFAQTIDSIFFAKGEYDMRSIKHLNSLTDLLAILSNLREYLDGKIAFSEEGMPIFESEQLLCQWPSAVVPFYHRNHVKDVDHKKILISFFCKDQDIYPRYIRLFQDLDVYREYLGVAMPDVTVTWDMDLEFQQTLLLFNQLFLAVLAVNGIKVVFNTRCGLDDSQVCFRNIPKGAMWISGFLGCRAADDYEQARIYVNKILRIEPGKLLIYGKQDRLINCQLGRNGVNYRYYEDFHRMSIKEKKHGRL